jgi:hypothetical protein
MFHILFLCGQLCARLWALLPCQLVLRKRLVCAILSASSRKHQRRNSMVVQRCACRSFLCLVLIAAALAARSQAQNITLDGSLGGARGPLAGPNYMIPADVGQIRGGNLFHSFGRFTVQTGESATFTPPLNGTRIVKIIKRDFSSGVRLPLSARLPLQSAKN